MYALHHVQLAMPRGREDEARQFFGGVLGFGEIGKPSELAQRGGVWFRAGTLELHLGVEEPFVPAEKAHPGILTEELDHLAERLHAAGISVRPDHELPGHRRFSVDDCFGNRLEFLEQESVSAADEPRDAEQRVRDARARLEGDHDLWIATARDGQPWLVPLSFHWTGQALLMATLRRSPTYRNLSEGSGARVTLGHTRDVVMLDGELDLPERLPEDQAAATATASGYDPRTEHETGYVRFVPRRVQAWRTAAEIEDRTIMRDGRWTVPI